MTRCLVSVFFFVVDLALSGPSGAQGLFQDGHSALLGTPENPVEVGHFDTVPWDESVTFDGSWSNYPFFESGTIVVSSGKEGVFFLKYRRPELVP